MTTGSHTGPAFDSAEQATGTGGPAAWCLWERDEDEIDHPHGLEAGDTTDGADLLKVLLARAAGILEENPAALLVLMPGRAGEDGTASQLLGGLSAMELDGLIMDERTAGMLPPPYRTERIGFLPGLLAEPFCAHRLEARKAVTAEKVTPPARADLWNWLVERIEKNGERDSIHQINITGPAGAGKSHLIGALVTWLVSRGMTVARVSCLPSDVPGTFSAWRELLSQIGGTRVPEVVKSLGEELTLDEGLVKNLVRFLSEPIQADPAVESGLTQLQYKDILPEFTAAVLVRLVGSLPVAVIVDDIQWMDEGSQSVVSALGRLEGSLLLVIGRRGQPAPEDIPLGPMSLEEHRHLLTELSGFERVTDELNHEIHRISGGLPLVSREAMAVMSKRRRLLSMGGTLDLAAESEIGAAGSKGEMTLTERFRDLSPRLRALLGACAVWREPFTRKQAELTALACSPGIDFKTCWESSSLGEFIVSAPGARGRFAFYHDLLREAALSLLSDRDRVAGHGAALEWMTAKSPRDFSPSEAAFHARESGRDEEAMDLFDRAARAALGRFALREAREAARAALELDRPAEHGGNPVAIARRARLLQIEGEAAFHWGMVEDAVTLLEKALVLYGVSPRQGQFPISPGMLMRHGWLFITGRPKSGATASPVLEGAARAALMLAEISYFQNDQKRSAECCITALDLASKNGESAVLASLCAAIACPMSGRRPRWLAERYRDIARAMIGRVGDQTEKTYIEHVGCLVDLDKGRWQEAMNRAAGNVDYWRSHGHGRRVEEAATHAFFVAYFQGNLSKAAEWAGILNESAVKRTDRQSRTWAAMMGSLHALACHGPKEAEAQCRQIANHGGDAITQASIHVMRAICAWRSGNPWQAMERLRDAEDLAGTHAPVSSTQFLIADASVLLGEMRVWGPPELSEDRQFGDLTSRFMKRTAQFATSFEIGMPILLCAKGLHGTGGGGEFLKAGKAAGRLGAKFFEARAKCFHAVKAGGAGVLEDGLDLLAQCGAEAEIAKFKQLSIKT
ncbi:ATP-binding protein [Luteolibacter luteus]|uniref:AAA family ATPase n=1 Tax=Luteolibacter luteus TaxID=2728835 RepID=A0A858RGQ3_9BACT|nr:AAA family ATPase [Luteolibacter luteus]QJE96336.1 AAA family ATPase [Luteolibacter luteus]